MVYLEDNSILSLLSGGPRSQSIVGLPPSRPRPQTYERILKFGAAIRGFDKGKEDETLRLIILSEN